MAAITRFSAALVTVAAACALSMAFAAPAMAASYQVSLDASGATESIVYASVGETFDSDLSNVWTVSDTQDYLGLLLKDGYIVDGDVTVDYGGSYTTFAMTKGSYYKDEVNHIEGYQWSGPQFGIAGDCTLRFSVAKPIDSLEFTADAPTAGDEFYSDVDTASYAIVGDDIHFGVNKAEWFTQYGLGGTPLVFEAGELYYVEITVTPDAGYTFVDPTATINGESALFYQVNATEWVASSQPVAIDPYEIIAGKDASWKPSSGGLKIVSDADFSKFIKVTMDGETVDPANFDAASGSTEVTFKASYLKTLSVGTHEAAIVSSGGEASTTITILAEDAQEESGDSPTTTEPGPAAPAAPAIPATGDASGVVAAALLTCAIVGAVAILHVRKRIQ